MPYFVCTVEIFLEQQLAFVSYSVSILEFTGGQEQRFSRDGLLTTDPLGGRVFNCIVKHISSYSASSEPSTLFNTSFIYSCADIRLS